MITGELEHTEYISEISQEDTGGGCIVQFVHLKNGNVIGITDDCIALYPSIHAFYTGEGSENIKSIMIS